MSSIKSQDGVTKLSAPEPVVPVTIPLNGNPPLGYRIGTSDRTVMDFSDAPDGFYVFNQTNGNVFQSVMVAFSVLSSEITDTDTEITLDDASGFPGGSVNSFILCESEVMNVISKSGNTLSVKRGVRQTSAAAHDAATDVTYTIWTAWGSVGDLDAVDSTLIDRWFNTIPTYPLRSRQDPDVGPGPGIPYRIGTTDRTIGADAEGAPDGFLVLNKANNKIFVVTAGKWAAATEFPNELYNAWLERWVPSGSVITSKSQSGTTKVS
jgi:hypothetical protein